MPEGGQPSAMETPPRAWGRLGFEWGALPRWRNTPTSVGKTAIAHKGPCFARKHPHERGEDGLTPKVYSLALETPPRAWGRLLAYAVPWMPWRNTPTSVGKTLESLKGLFPYQKHPHERGEDFSQGQA